MRFITTSSIFLSISKTRFPFVSLFAVVWLASHLSFGSNLDQTRYDFFETKVRPLLLDRCSECHGEQKQKGGLRLDSSSSIARGGNSGAAIIPGDPAQSLLFKAISWHDPELQMPPKNKLPQNEIQILHEWIVQGAFLPSSTEKKSVEIVKEEVTHWAYQPLQKVSRPSPANSHWCYNDIDRFVLAQLERQNIHPVRDAARRPLLRRLYFDLIGLPPSPEDLEAFLADDSSDAYEKVVTKLLAMPEFGERWGRHWLDVVRFAESVTLRGFVYKEAWRYRDYVIAAFNSDMPFDQFIREQIAGDLLPADTMPAKRRQHIATTFLAPGNTNLEEQDKAQLRMDIVDEQLDTIGKAFLAQTIGCARCHDHKFDPIPTSDYYAMAGILRNTITVTNANVSGWLEMPLPVDAETEERIKDYEVKIAAVTAEIKLAKAQLATFGKGMGNGAPELDSSFPPSISVKDLPGIIVDSAQAKAVGEWKHSTVLRRYVGDGYLHDDATGKGEKTLTFTPEIKKAGKYEVRFSYLHSPSRSTKVPLTVFHGDGETVVYVNQQEPPQDGRFVSLGQFRFEGNGFGYVVVSNEGTSGHVTADAAQFIPLGTGDSIAQQLPPEASHKPSPSSSLQSSNLDLNLKSLEARLKQLQTESLKRERYMGVREDDTITDTYIHIRGSVHNKGPVVPRGFMSIATQGVNLEMPASESGRKELAEWIASSANPLTARVMVNRIWHGLFGAGLVRTTDNFGTTGEVPSHPEMLDYLANKFVDEGWSVKKLIREMVLSHTYQLAYLHDCQQHVEKAACEQVKDPENRLLWRANRSRLEAEAIRDSLLVISGELSGPRSGPSFKTGLSADYGFTFNEPRRSVFVPVFRNSLPEIFEVFDFADPSMVVGTRNTTTAAPQALFLLNHPFVRHQAVAAAKRLLNNKADTDLEEKIKTAYLLTLSREPSSSELQLAKRHLTSEQGNMEVWTDLFHSLFASAEFRYIE